jgi:hypothetical protein
MKKEYLTLAVVLISCCSLFVPVHLRIFDPELRVSNYNEDKVKVDHRRPSKIDLKLNHLGFALAVKLYCPFP